MPYHQGRGDEPPEPRHRGSRHEGRSDNPARRNDLDGEGAELRIARVRPREPSPNYDTHYRSSHQRSHRTAASSRRAVDGSETSISQSDTYRDYRYASRQTTRDTVRPLDPYDNTIPLSRNEDPFRDLGTWTDNPPRGGWPEPTYGHNGYRPTDFPPTISGPDILDSIRAPRWSSQQPTEPATRVNVSGGPSRRDDRLPRSRSRSREGHRPHTDDIREHHNSRERHERRERREHREYHEAHAYSERRDRDQRRYASLEPIPHESNGRRRQRSRSREPRYR